MKQHFLFTPGEWLGEGSITFSISPDILDFRMKWTVEQSKDNLFLCTQKVEVLGGDTIVNLYKCMPEKGKAFSVILENELLGTFTGIGVLEENSIAWEFRKKEVFEGFEIYKELSPDEYQMHAEYVSPDETRTKINGRMWKKTTASIKDAISRDAVS